MDTVRQCFGAPPASGRPLRQGRAGLRRSEVVAAAARPATAGSSNTLLDILQEKAAESSGRTHSADSATFRSGTAEIQAQDWTLQEYQKFFKNCGEEDYWISDVEGQIPPDIEGTFYRNGPGLLELGGQKMHCFDGHGLVARIGLLNGRAHFRSRFVRTPVYEEEVRAGRILYRGFGSQKPGGTLANFMDIRDKPVANTSLIEWGGRLWALWEAHNPFLLDACSLETIGEEYFGGALREAQPFTAHPCYDPHTGRLIAFSNGIRHAEGKLHIWELSTDCKIVKAISHKTGMLPIMYLHDFKVTKNWYVFHQAPLGLHVQNALRYFWGQCDQTQQVFFEGNRAGDWVLVPRDGGAIVRVPSDPMMIWHYANAFEDAASGKIIVDACVMDSFDFQFDMRDPFTFPNGGVARFTIDPRGGTSTRSTILDCSADFPQINPAFTGSANYRFIYLAGAAEDGQAYPFRRIVKLDVGGQTKQTTSWLAPPGCFVGEPVFVPRVKLVDGNGSAAGEGERQQMLEGRACDASPIEDDGYVVFLVSDGRKERSTLVILDARRLEEGPLAQIHLRSVLPMAFHCLWSAAAQVPAP